jgi:hypothetical protein
MGKLGIRRFASEGWPKSKVLAAMRRRYSAVEDLGDEDGLSLYGVADGEIRFAVALIIAGAAYDRVMEVGFLARFTGFARNPAWLEALNRNLHISVATFHADGDLYLIGGVSADGDYSDGSFTLVLEAWKRDLLVVLHAMSPAASYLEAFPAGRSKAARRFARNSAPTTQDGDRDLFAAFAAGAHRATSLCPSCAGRGKVGLIARRCADCDGVGLLARPRR